MSVVLIFFLLLAAAYPFIGADADLLLSSSRGPLTDEGLYTLQAHNALITGQWNLSESDAMVKSPLFSLYAWLVLGGIENSMIAMRLACLLFVAAALAL